MEKTKLESPKINENLTLIGRKSISLTGIKEINNSSETMLNLKLQDTTLLINGENINITKFDIDNELLEATGNFNSIKYGKSGNIFKRIFK